MNIIEAIVGAIRSSGPVGHGVGATEFGTGVYRVVDSRVVGRTEPKSVPLKPQTSSNPTSNSLEEYDESSYWPEA